MKFVTAFKHLFIPHEHNEYKPHFFREVSVATIIIGSIFMLGFSAGSSFLIHKTVLGASVTANVLVDLTNESRLAFNEDPLVRSPILDHAATLKADDMSTVGYFAHNSPTGVTPWHWFQEAGYTFLYAGENLAINFIDANEVRDAWLASPLHRANLLDVKFKEIGMATVSGVYKGSPSIYVVQMFGTPAKAVRVAAISVATTTPSLVPAGEKKAETSTNLATSSMKNNAILAQRPEIKGEFAGAVSVVTQPAAAVPVYEPIVTNSKLAVVKNNDNVEPVDSPKDVQKYSAWYERFLFGGSYYVDIAYKVLIGLVFVALLTMILIEVRKQHWKHITYGLSLLLIISLCIIINQTFW